MTDTMSAWPRYEGGVTNQEPAGTKVVGAWLYEPAPRPLRARRYIDEPALREAVRAYGYDAQRICEHFGISRRHLQRWFRLHMQSTPNVWLAELRMQHARRLLATSNSVKEVAYSLGFKQASQFSRDFKRRFGHQPSVEKRASCEADVATPRSSQASWRCELGAAHAVLQG